MFSRKTNSEFSRIRLCDEKTITNKKDKLLSLKNLEFICLEKIWRGGHELKIHIKKSLTIKLNFSFNTANRVGSPTNVSSILCLVSLVNS